MTPGNTLLLCYRGLAWQKFIMSETNEEELAPAMKKAIEKRKLLERERKEQLDQKRQSEEDKKNSEDEKTRRRWERNYSSEDSKLDEDNLVSYYCSYCAAFSLIMDISMEDLKKRSADGYRTQHLPHAAPPTRAHTEHSLVMSARRQTPPQLCAAGRASSTRASTCSSA